MDRADLLRFLLDANRYGYVAGRNATKLREADHSTTIVYESGGWRFHDNYFGGEETIYRSGQCVYVARYAATAEGATPAAVRPASRNGGSGSSPRPAKSCSSRRFAKPASG